MIIKCFRCGKKIDPPNSSNADYVIAADMVVKEPRQVLIALKHNEASLAKEAMMKETLISTIEGEEVTAPKHPDMTIADNEYDAVEIPFIEARDADTVKVLVETRQKDIQKTGVICPKCYKSTDTVVWGVHKKG